MAGDDLLFALELVDVAAATAMAWFDPAGVASATKEDGSPVTEADVAVEEALRSAVRGRFPNDGFLGEEVGETGGSSRRRWIVDGIDGTRFFAAGSPTWGTLVALEVAGAVEAAAIIGPALGTRWWAERSGGAHVGRIGAATEDAQRLEVRRSTELRPDRFITLPRHDQLTAVQRQAVEALAGGVPPDRTWSHPLLVATGEVDVSVWFTGGPWDLAAPSLIVAEAGGRFSDHRGTDRIDTRTAIFSNGVHHQQVVDVLSTLD